MKTKEELLIEYYDKEFTFKHLYKNIAKYEKQYKSRTIIVDVEIDYISDLELNETLSSLNSEGIIIRITTLIK